MQFLAQVINTIDYFLSFIKTMMYCSIISFTINDIHNYIEELFTVPVIPQPVSNLEFGPCQIQV